MHIQNRNFRNLIKQFCFVSISIVHRINKDIKLLCKKISDLLLIKLNSKQKSTKLTRNYNWTDFICTRWVNVYGVHLWSKIAIVDDSVNIYLSFIQYLVLLGLICIINYNAILLKLFRKRNGANTNFSKSSFPKFNHEYTLMYAINLCKWFPGCSTKQKSRNEK